MHRFLILTLALIAITLSCASAASAGPFDLETTPEIAMSDQSIYWVQHGASSCRNCRRLWRTDIASGRRSLVFVLKHGFIDDLHASARSVAFTVEQTGRKYRTSIRVFDEARGLATLASATYYPRRNASCGSQVGSSTISSSGEVAWLSIAFSEHVDDCEFFPEQAKWSAFASHADTPPRMLLAARKLESLGVGYRFAFGGPIHADGFDGRRLLTFGSVEGTSMYDTATGSRASYDPGADSLADRFEMKLGPSGAVTAVGGEFTEAEPTDVGILLPNPMDPGTVVSLPLKHYQTVALNPCGSRLVQLGVKSRSATVVVRDAAGAVLSMRAMKLPDNADVFSLECNSKLALFRYGLLPDEPGGGIISSRSRTIAIN